MEKAFPDADGKATFVCPSCSASISIDVTEHLKTPAAVRTNCNCKCGNTFKAILERRQNKRVDSNLKGIYIRLVEGKETGHGLVAIKDISPSGVRMKLNAAIELTPRDKLVVILFQNEQTGKSLIREHGSIKYLNTSHIGAEFSQEERTDKSMAFYLYSE